MAGTMSGKIRPLIAEGGTAQDERGDQGDGVGLEQVGGHAGAVADVVTHVVRDGGGVAWVVLGDALLDLADQVGADVGGLGEDAAADPHEHGQQRGTETEALQHLRRAAGVDQDHDGGAQQAETGGRQTHGAAGAEGDLHGAFATFTVGRGGHPDVRPGRQPHADVADGRREQRADQEEDRSADALAHGRCGQYEEQHEHDDHEDRQRPELPAEVGGRALLHRFGDFLHLGGALAGGEHAGPQHKGDDQRDNSNHRHSDDDELITTGDGEVRGKVGGHRTPDPCVARTFLGPAHR